jgi:hypothetical protein
VRGRFTENLPLKVIAIIIALVLYLFVMQEKEGVREYRVELEVVEPPGYVLMNELPTLRVAVAGRTRNLTDLEGDELSRLELRPDPGTTQRWFEAEDFDLPPGLEIRSIFPEYVQLDLARLVPKEVQILASIDGQPPPGYSYSYSVHPSTITVEGPEATLETMNAILTETVDVSGLDDSDSPYTFKVDLVTRRPRVTYDTQVDVFVVVRVELDEDTTSLSIPVVVAGPVERAEVDRDFVNIRITGPAASIDSLDASTVTAEVDATPYADVTEAVRVSVEPTIRNLPEGVWVDPDTLLALWLTVEPPEARYAFVPVPYPSFLPTPMPPLYIPPEVWPATDDDEGAEGSQQQEEELSPQ